MRRMRLTAGYMSIGFILIFLFGGCALYDQFFGDEEEKKPEELMTEGRERLEKGDYEAATEAFQNIKDKYPYSKFAVEAEMKMADSLYKRKEYDAAYVAYDDFERLHPKDRNIPYIIFRKGMCNFLQVISADRDQSHTLRAKEDFERLIKNFPRDDHVNKARRNLRECFISLAEYELYVGHYYYKMGKYRTAMGRYRYLVENYPDMGQYHEALEFLAKCKERLAEEGK